MRLVCLLLRLLRLMHCQLYFEDADEYAPLLNIKKTRKRTVKGSKRPSVPMVCILRSLDYGLSDQIRLGFLPTNLTVISKSSYRI